MCGERSNVAETCTTDGAAIASTVAGKAGAEESAILALLVDVPGNGEEAAIMAQVAIVATGRKSVLSVVRRQEV